MTALNRISLMSLALCATLGWAQVTGPAPMAWRWAQPTSVSPRGPIAAEGDTVYAAVGGRIYGLDRELGTQRWRYPAAQPLDTNFVSGVVVSGDTVMAASDGKTVYAVDAKTGAAKWQYNSPANIVGTPVVCNRYLVMALGDSTIMAVLIENGQPAWSAPQRIFDGLMGALAVHQNNILYFTLASELVAMDVTSQNKVWGRRLSQVSGDVRPTVFGDHILLNSGNYLIKLSAGDGRRVFEINTQEVLARNPAADENGIVSMTRSGGLIAFDHSGRVLYKKPTELLSGPVADPLLINGWATVPLQNGTVSLVDFKSGELRWNYQIRPMAKQEAVSGSKPVVIQASSAPILSGDSLLVPARDGSIMSFSRSHGVDLTPPEVRMVFPSSGEQVSGRPPLDLFWLLSDEASGFNPKSIRVDVDGKTLDHVLNKDGYVIVTFGGNSKNQPLSDGRKVFTITVSDWLGNVREAKFSLTIDNSLAPIKPKTSKDNDRGPGGGRPGRGEGL